MNVKYSFEVWTKDGMKLIAHGNAKDPDHAVERMKPHMKRGYEGVLIQDGEPIQNYSNDLHSKRHPILK